MDMPKQSKIEQMQESVHERLYSRLDLIQETYEANKRSIKNRSTATEYWCTGTMSLTSVIINTGIKIKDIEFNEYPEILKFKGTSWGLGVGYGTSFGTGVFSEKPKKLIGRKVNIELAFVMYLGGIIQTSFWDDGWLIGAMDFIAGGGGAGVFWGDGKFSEQS